MLSKNVTEQMLVSDHVAEMLELSSVHDMYTVDLERL